MAVSAAVVGAAPAAAGVGAVVTIGEVATLFGYGFAGGAVVADGIAGGYTSGVESGVGSASDAGLLAAGESGIGKAAAGIIGAAKSALDFAVGPSCTP